ncbi:MAG: hypothetical protein IJ762_09075 [Bacteroidaceae bacterium]|nr:hypothetical protein [Bacteroidaceae bacterium]MBR1789322.1 hypothetical protein [Bacteroidaceae bacterium]
MEKIIRLMTNNRTYDEQTNLVERMNEITEFAGVVMACMVVLAAMAIV